MFCKQKIKPLFSLISAIFLVGALSACVETVDMKKAIETSHAMESSQLSADIRLASAAIAMRMKGYGADDISGVTFANTPDITLEEDGTSYDGFVLKGLNILSYTVTEGDATRAELSGILLFSDTLDRRAGARFLVNYQFNGGGIFMTHASVTPVYALDPETEAYVVPFNPSADMSSVSNSLDSLYNYAVSNAIPPGSLSGKGDYDIFLFTMDRVSPTSKQVGRISKNTKKKHGFEGATTTLDYNGWPALIISGQFDLGSGNKLYAKALHTPGDETLFFLRNGRIVGLFGVTQGTLVARDGATNKMLAAAGH